MIVVPAVGDGGGIDGRKKKGKGKQTRERRGHDCGRGRDGACLKEETRGEEGPQGRGGGGGGGP